MFDIVNSKVDKFKVGQLVEFVDSLMSRLIKVNKNGAVKLYSKLFDLSSKLEDLDSDSLITGRKFNSKKIIVECLEFCDIISI